MNWSRENDFYVFFLSAKAGPFIFLFSGFFHELSHYVFRMRILPIDTHHHYWLSSMESFFSWTLQVTLLPFLLLEVIP